MPSILVGFREYARTEASALATQLVAAAEAHLQTSLQSMQEEHEAAMAALHAQFEQKAKEQQDQAGALGEARAALQAVQAAFTRAEAARKEDARAKTTAERELEELRAQLESAQAEADRGATQLEIVLEELRQEHVTTMREQAIAYRALPLEGLQTIFNDLAKAPTTHDVLTALVTGLSREFSRVALFSLQGNRLEGVHQLGFDFSDISKVAIPTTVDSILTRAVGSGHIESFVSGQQDEPCRNAPFGGAPACALALPIVVDGETLGVIYADDSDRMEFASVPPPLLSKFAELLLQHTLLVLLRVGTDQKKASELKAYATMLIDEMEFGHNADVGAGKADSECRNRLRDALELSRRIYAGRTAGESPSAAAILDHRLAAVVEAQSATPFGRDLAAVVRETTQSGGSSVFANCG